MRNKIIYFIVGTRAQLIKMAPVMKEFENRNISYLSIYTCQHKETIEDLWKEFEIHPADIVLNIKKEEAKTVFAFFKWFFDMFLLFFSTRKIFIRGKGIVITHGDTITSVWGAIIGKIGGNKIAHLESGLRSFNIFHPFPEEINRLIIFTLTDYYFCPNEWSINNLKNFSGEKINTEGNTLLDAVRDAVGKSQKPPLNIEKPYCVLSMHRFENLYPTKNLKRSCKIIDEIAKYYKVVFILHPITKKRIERSRLVSKLLKNKSIIFQERMNFFNFIALIYDSEFLATDGGSNQEESSYLGLPCLLLRHKTERIEGLSHNVVLSNYEDSIIKNFLFSYKNYRQKPFFQNKSPSTKITDYLLSIK